MTNLPRVKFLVESLANCVLNEGNCASLEVASKRIRAIGKELQALLESASPSEPRPELTIPERDQLRRTIEGEIVNEWADMDRTGWTWEHWLHVKLVAALYEIRLRQKLHGDPLNAEAFARFSQLAPPRPYPDHTKLLERLKHLSFSITGNDYAFLAENPEIEEALKVYRENVIEDAAEPRRDEANFSQILDEMWADHQKYCDCRNEYEEDGKEAELCTTAAIIIRHMDQRGARASAAPLLGTCDYGPHPGVGETPHKKTPECVNWEYSAEPRLIQALPMSEEFAIKWMQICRPHKIGPSVATPESLTEKIRSQPQPSAGQLDDKCPKCKRPKKLHIPDAGKLACPVQSMDESVPIQYWEPSAGQTEGKHREKSCICGNKVSPDSRSGMCAECITEKKLHLSESAAPAQPVLSCQFCGKPIAKAAARGYYHIDAKDRDACGRAAEPPSPAPVLTPSAELDEMVRDFCKVGPKPKSEVRRRILEYAAKSERPVLPVPPDGLDDQPFYEVMQAYRHTPIVEQQTVVYAFEDVKRWIRERFVARSSSPAVATNDSYREENFTCTVKTGGGAIASCVVTQKTENLPAAPAVAPMNKQSDSSSDHNFSAGAGRTQGHKHTDACYSRVPESEGTGEYLNCGLVAGTQGDLLAAAEETLKRLGMPDSVVRLEDQTGEERLSDVMAFFARAALRESAREAPSEHFCDDSMHCHNGVCRLSGSCQKPGLHAQDFLDTYAENLRIRDGEHKSQIIKFAVAYANHLIGEASPEAPSHIECEGCGRSGPLSYVGRTYTPKTSTEAPAAKEACSIDLIVEMEALLDTHCENGGCDQEDCGCPGSRLRVLVNELRNEFGDLTAPAVTKEK